MKPLTQFKTTIPPARKPMSLVSAGFLIPLLLACLGLAPMAQAVGPDTDGNIPGSNNGEGIGVLVSRTTGVWNTGTGFEALSQLTAGNQNTATGLRALNSDINGGYNTATGVFSLSGNTGGFFNSATGAYALANNTIGNNNTANGYASLYRNTADSNTAAGFAALYHNTTGTLNTANGLQALFSNTTGIQNTANGYQALYSNTTGVGNTAEGYQALDSNTTGNNNAAVGTRALGSNTTSSWNVAIGNGALSFTNTAFDDANTAVGYGALGALGNFLNATGSNNIALGYGAGGDLIEGNNNIYVGNFGPSNFPGQEDNTIRIGDAQTITFIAGISGATASGGAAVYVNSSGQLGTSPSSARFKKDIKSMGKASEALYALQPVTFHYKKELDPSGIPQFGLVAEDVEKVNPDLVVRGKNGKAYSVRYDQVNAMLLNEFLKERRKVEQQEATITQLKSTVAQQRKGLETVTARLEEQAAQIQKVSDQLEVSKPAPQVVNNNQ